MSINVAKNEDMVSLKKTIRTNHLYLTKDLVETIIDSIRDMSKAMASSECFMEAEIDFRDHKIAWNTIQPEHYAWIVEQHGRSTFHGLVNLESALLRGLNETNEEVIKGKLSQALLFIDLLGEDDAITIKKVHKYGPSCYAFKNPDTGYCVDIITPRGIIERFHNPSRVALIDDVISFLRRGIKL